MKADVDIVHFRSPTVSCNNDYFTPGMRVEISGPVPEPSRYQVMISPRHLYELGDVVTIDLELMQSISWQ